MNVIIINESQGAALKRTRRILSKYLPQLGSLTWAGHIPEQGLEELHLKLKAAASKSAAICCHRVVTRSRTEVMWFVGSRSPFHEDGRYAFRVTAAKPGAQDFKLPRGPLVRLLRHTVEMAALSHDLGKSGLGFQQSLASPRASSQAIRHDLLSFLVWMESLYAVAADDKAVFSLLADNPSAAASCATATHLAPREGLFTSRVLEALKRPASAASLLMTDSEIQGLYARAPVFMTVAWLVLTHHRLPEGDQTWTQLDPHRHLNFPSEGRGASVATAETSITCAPGAKPWEEDRWQTSMAGCAKRILECLGELEAGGELQGLLGRLDFWPQVAAHYLRPLLIVGDYIGSQQAQPHGVIRDAFGKETIFANLAKDKLHAGDPLSVHLLKVKHAARRMALLAEGADSDFAKTTLPAKSVARASIAPSKFQWQLELERACAKASGGGPVFVSVIAETGAGKTIGAVRALQGLQKGQLRFTLAMGSRDLTSQFATSLLEDCLIPKSDLVVAIGQPSTLGLSKLAAAVDLAAQEVPGSESADISELQQTQLDFAGEDIPAEQLAWLPATLSLEQAQDVFRTKALRMLSAPVLACTVDHLVGSVSLQKGRSAPLYPRLSSSALVLDELDSYSPSALSTLARLAYVAGLHGQHLLVLSATLSPPAKSGLYLAWREGVEAGARMRLAKPSHSVVYCSNLLTPEVHVNPSSSEAADAWAAYTTRLCLRYADPTKSVVRRTLALVPASFSKLKEAFELVHETAELAHSRNFQVDPRTQRRVSVGIVKFTRAKTVQRFCAYLEARSTTKIRYVPFHSKYPRSNLGVLDATLTQVCYRAQGELDYLNVPSIRKAVDGACEQDVVIVIVATSLAETGRDFDVDWAIAEPSTPRALIQLAGRVRRHRFWAFHAVNVYLLGAPLVNAKRKRYWSRPGVEDYLLGKQVTVENPLKADETPEACDLTTLGQRKRPPQLVRATEQAFPVQQWYASLDAQVCLQAALTYEDNRIGYLEQHVQQEFLTHSGSGTQFRRPLPWYLSSLGPLNAKAVDATRLREYDGPQALFRPEAAGISYLAEDGQWRRCPDGQVLHTPSPRALLQDLASKAQQVETLRKGDEVMGCQLRASEVDPSATQLTWHPAWGFIEGNLEADEDED